jgi:hypothetical protein
MYKLPGYVTDISVTWLTTLGVGGGGGVAN